MAIRSLKVAIWLAAVALVGCRGTQTDTKIIGYYGKTDSMPAVVEKINANNSRIPTARGAGNFEAWIKDNGKTSFVNGELTFLYSAPRSLRLIGKKPVVGSVFEIASNDDRYWVIVRPPDDKDHAMWWGEHRNVDRLAPGSIPVRPDLVLEVLGIRPLDPNDTDLPAPVMRFNNDNDAYMFLWIEKRPDRLIAQKEVWYDRKTLLPKLVLLFDDDGRIVLRAYLSQHKPIEAPNTDGLAAPMMATHFDLFFPDTQSKMTFDLNEDLALKRNNAPNARSFVFPDDPGVARVKHLDEQARP